MRSVILKNCLTGLYNQFELVLEPTISVFVSSRT